jgi:hypothetical protein
LNTLLLPVVAEEEAARVMALAPEEEGPVDTGMALLQ